MAEKLQPVRGTHDLLPEEHRKYRHVVDTARAIAERYNYSQMETPIFEFSDVFHRTLGETSDVVTKETYTFTDRGGESITLRPEFTAAAVRAYLSNGLTNELPLKWFYAGPAFRYERPQKGRLRQFHQFGCELFGIAEPYADIETIALGQQILEALGLKGKVRLEINTLGDTESRQAYRAALVQYFSAHKRSLSEESLGRLEKNPLRILDSKDENDRKLCKDAPAMQAHLSPAAKTFFDAVKSGLGNLGIAFIENPNIVRGLDYYNHTVFEFIADIPELGVQNTVLAGGRYDGLIQQMGGSPTPGVGFAAGVERLMLAGQFSLPPIRPIAVIPIGDAMEPHALAVAQTLRQSGITCELIIRGNIGKAMKKANGLNATAAVLIGEEEWKTAEVTLKTLDSGEQTRMGMAELAPHLKTQKL